LEFDYLALCLQALLFGIYSGLFAMHLKYDAIKRETDNRKRNIIFYALCLLYLLTMAVFATDIATPFIGEVTVGYRLATAGGVLFGCGDFIAQAILIHRCWIVWGRNIRLVVIPSILAFVYLVIWMAGMGSTFIDQGVIRQHVWGEALVLTGLTASMIVNALVTGLIVFRIFKVKRVSTPEDKSFGITRRHKLQVRSVLFVIIESGMALFAIQLARVAISATQGLTNAEYYAFLFITSIQEILNGIAPTIILVRVSLGLSFDNEKSLVEAVSSLRFGTDNPNPIPGTGSIDQNESLDIGHDDPNPLSDMHQRSREDDSGEVTISR